MAQTLHNIYDKKILRQRLSADSEQRVTFSFYRYVAIADPAVLRDVLYEKWVAMRCMGRVYLAHEGVNAQMSVPVAEYDRFVEDLYAIDYFNNVPIKVAIEDDGKSFYKLAVKVRRKLVADGIDDAAFDVSNVGKHLSAAEFNEAIDRPDTLVVDMRNHYESEVGRFSNAICPDADTFRDELPMVAELLADQKDKKIVLYCTGGIRCEKASAYLKHIGFEDVNQLHGGIIDYVQQVKSQGLDNRFVGKNFVFDERLGERISDDVIAHCHQCGSSCDTHTNCANDDCHLLFIQCEACKSNMNGCCSEACSSIAQLSPEEQRALRKGKTKPEALAVHHKSKGRLRPKLNDD